jgi:hypothetical protein
MFMEGGFYAKLNDYSLFIHNYSYNTQNINLQNVSQLNGS